MEKNEDTWIPSEKELALLKTMCERDRDGNETKLDFWFNAAAVALAKLIVSDDPANFNEYESGMFYSLADIVYELGKLKVN